MQLVYVTDATHLCATRPTYACNSVGGVGGSRGGVGGRRGEGGGGGGGGGGGRFASIRVQLNLTE